MSANRLGRGLEALIRSNEDVVSGMKPGVIKIPLNLIDSNPYQPRKEFDESGLAELAASIREKGVLTPVTVQAVESRFVLIAGERRCRAARMAEISEIPAYVIEVSDEADMMEMALIENIQRENLNPVEEAEGYAVLHSKFDLSQERIAKAVGKNRVTVANTLRLLNLPPKIKADLKNGTITAGHGRAILMMKTPRAMEKLWKTIKTHDLSVRKAEQLARDRQDGKGKKTASKRPADPGIQALENDLIGTLGTKVKLRSGKKGGVIEISYFSDEELERLVEFFHSLET
ncbi:MAG: ParB/RepB/Spo0J family partition protein [Fidelibacterota bacterium]